jgi:hypothetical protein
MDQLVAFDGGHDRFQIGHDSGAFAGEWYLAEASDQWFPSLTRVRKLLTACAWALTVRAHRGLDTGCGWVSVSLGLVRLGGIRLGSGPSLGSRGSVEYTSWSTMAVRPPLTGRLPARTMRERIPGQPVCLVSGCLGSASVQVTASPVLTRPPGISRAGALSRVRASACRSAHRVHANIARYAVRRCW